jgi:hypothetical protein
LSSTLDSNFEVRPYAPADRGLWDGLVERSRSRHFLFRRDYMDYHRDRFEDASAIVLDNGVPVAIFPANRAGIDIVSHGGLTFGGILSGPELTARRTVAVLRALCIAYAASGAERLVYKAVPAIYDWMPAEEDLYALFVLGASLVRRECSAALRPLDRPPLSKGRRSAVRRAHQAGFDIGRDPAVAEFMELDREALRRRHGAEPVHSPAEMDSLAAALPDNIKLFSARRDAKMMAGVIVYETPTVAHTQYIAASEAGYEAHAIDAVIDHLLHEEYVDKPWFDFGTSNADGGQMLNVGLIRNKESWGARTIIHDTYQLDLGDGERALG